MHRYLLYRLHPFDLDSKLFQKPFCKTLHRFWNSTNTRFDPRFSSEIGESRNAPCLFGGCQPRTLGLAWRMAPSAQISRLPRRSSCLCKHCFYLCYHCRFHRYGALVGLHFGSFDLPFGSMYPLLYNWFYPLDNRSQLMAKRCLRNHLINNRKTKVALCVQRQFMGE